MGPPPRLQPPVRAPHFSLGKANPAHPSILAGRGRPRGPQRPHLQVTWLIFAEGGSGVPPGSAELGPGRGGKVTHLRFLLLDLLR